MLQYITTLFLKRCESCEAVYPKDREYFHVEDASCDGFDNLCIPCREAPFDLLRYEEIGEIQTTLCTKIIPWVKPRAPNRPRQQYTDKKAAKRAANLHQWAKPEMKIWLKIYRHNRRAQERNLSHTLTRDEWKYCQDYFHGCCAVCGRQGKDLFGTHRIAADHWIPLSSPDCPGTTATNIIPLCHGIDGCNNRKHRKLPEQWLIEQFGKRKAKEVIERISSYFASLKITP